VGSRKVGMETQAWRRFGENPGGRVPKVDPVFFTVIYGKRVMQAKQAITGTHEKVKGVEAVLAIIMKSGCRVLEQTMYRAE